VPARARRAPLASHWLCPCSTTNEGQFSYISIAWDYKSPNCVTSYTVQTYRWGGGYWWRVRQRGGGGQQARSVWLPPASAAGSNALHAA